jgi:predicted permease
MLMMVLCCALPIIAVMAVLVLFPGNPYSGFLILVLCPLAMLLIHLPQALSRKKRSSEKHEH